MANLLITIGDCDVIDNNYIGSKDTASEFGCFIACVTTEDCNYYNWFTDLYHRDGCSLFSVCDTVSPCSYHGVHISWHTYNYCSSTLPKIEKEPLPVQKQKIRHMKAKNLSSLVLDGQGGASSLHPFY